MNYKLALTDVLDATPEEARRVPCDKLLPFMRKWVTEAEARKMKKHPLVQLAMKDAWTHVSVQATVDRWTGFPPWKVEVRGGGVYFLSDGDERFARNLLEFHG